MTKVSIPCTFNFPHNSSGLLNVPHTAAIRRSWLVAEFVGCTRLDYFLPYVLALLSLSHFRFSGFCAYLK